MSTNWRSALDPAAKNELIERFNPAALFRLAQNKELGPQLAPLIDDWMKAAQEFRRDRQRLAGFVAQLSQGDEGLRAQAAVNLLRAHEASVAPLVAVLADPARAGEHAVAQQMLVHLNGSAVAPLLGVLESPDAALRAQVIDVLGRIGSPDAVPQLLGQLVIPSDAGVVRNAAAQALTRILKHTPNDAEALAMLEQAARAPLAASRDDGAESAALNEVWHWNRKTNESMPVTYDATGAQLAKAVRLARDLHVTDPAQPEWRRLYLTAMLQAAKLRVGLSSPLAAGPGTAYAVAAFYGADILDDVLAHALADRYIPAATGAAQILGNIGNATLLSRGGARVSPLAQAAGDADQRLRFTAIEAILKLAPNAPFAGSSNVTLGLGFLASSFGVPRALIVHPVSAEAATLAGLAAALGYETDIATNGRDAFEMAVASPDYDFILIHEAIDRPGVDDLVAQLRQDRRTALVPIGLLFTLDDQERIETFARSVPRAAAFLQPRDDAAMRLYVGNLLQLGGRWHVSAVERQAHATSALDWLTALAALPPGAFDVRNQEQAVEGALYSPPLSTHASAFPAQLGTPSSQRTLIELADNSSQPLAAQRAAATALAQSIEHFGLRLERDQILEQYDMYNLNGGRNGETHEVLSAVLDAIEQTGSPGGGS